MIKANSLYKYLPENRLLICGEAGEHWTDRARFSSAHPQILPPIYQIDRFKQALSQEQLKVYAGIYLAYGLSLLASHREDLERLLLHLEDRGCFFAVEALESDSLSPAQNVFKNYLKFIYGHELLPKSRIINILKSTGLTQICIFEIHQNDGFWNQKELAKIQDYVISKVKDHQRPEAIKLLSEIAVSGLDSTPIMLIGGFKRSEGGLSSKSSTGEQLETAVKRLYDYGPGDMDEITLLSMVLELDQASARKILKHYGGKSLLKERDLTKLSSLLGIDDLKTAKLLALLEIGKRLFHPENKARVEVHSPLEVYEYLSDMRELKREHLRGLYLDFRGRVLADEVIAIGALNRALVSPREILSPALECGASGLIIAHNHLSSIPEPSSEDVEMTAILENAAELMKIDLWDHIIVTTDGYYSFNEAGRIKVKKY